MPKKKVKLPYYGFDIKKELELYRAVCEGKPNAEGITRYTEWREHILQWWAQANSAAGGKVEVNAENFVHYLAHKRRSYDFGWRVMFQAYVPTIAVLVSCIALFVSYGQSDYLTVALLPCVLIVVLVTLYIIKAIAKNNVPSDNFYSDLIKIIEHSSNKQKSLR
jgi:hypothetical protein